MRKMYVICKNHLDLTWRRCFMRSFKYDDFIIRPYIEIEELLLDWWLDAIERDGFVYEIEQTVTLREYLKRSPESLPRIKKLISEGKIIMQGGGESIVDYNLSDGEAIIRNHFYSRRYLKKEFGVVPRFAACPDTFGLSAQLPQLFRKLGYPAISALSRVFKNAKPVWQGISGHQIAIETINFTDIGDSDFVKYYVCANCEGEGCVVCDHTGLDIYYRHFSLPGSLERINKQMKKHSQNEGDIVFSVGSEEVLEPDNFRDIIDNLANQYGYEVAFTDSESFIAEKYGDLISKVEKGSVSAELIDERQEGNPVAAGCYTSRIRIKQENRRIEAALQAAERLAALAASYGFTYPHAALEELWIKLSIYQFHDALPASHSDAAYEELLDIARDIRTAAMRIARRATKTITKNIAADDEHSFAVFNPLSWDVKGQKLEGVIRFAKDTPKPSGILIDADGKKINFSCSKRVEGLANNAWRIEFYGDIPALGYNIFKFVESSDMKYPKEITLGDTLENEFYVITLGERGIESIYDKRLQKEVAKDGVCSPYLSDDMGSLWGAWSPRCYAERADKPFCIDVMTPFRGHNINVSAVRVGEIQKAVVEIVYGRPEERLKDLRWKMTVSLRDGSDKIDFHIETSWEAKDLRLSARFPFGFTTNEDKGIYEIPLGQLERSYTYAYDEQLARSDDHAALRYFCAYHPEQDYTVGLFNTGTPAHRFQNGELYIGLMRSPTHLLCSYNIENAGESGTREFTFGFTSWKGDIHEGHPAQRGWEYNAIFPVQQLAAQTGLLPKKSSLFPNIPKEIMLSGLKLSEEGSDIILHCYEPYGIPSESAIVSGAKECDLISEQPVAIANAGHYAPYEIKALRLSIE